MKVLCVEITDHGDDLKNILLLFVLGWPLIKLMHPVYNVWLHSHKL